MSGEGLARTRMISAGKWCGRQLRLLFDIRANPATFVYLLILVVTSAVISAAGARLGLALLRTQSTNLANLRRDPIHVLFTSAFWLEGVRPLVLVLPFAFVLAPAERWLGTRRWITVFGLGHVLATVATAVLIAVELRLGWAAQSLTHTVDVGFSYGFAAIAGVLAHRLPAKWRPPYVAAGFAVLTVLVLGGATFTDVGHLVAWSIGLSCGWLVPRPQPARAGAATVARPVPAMVVSGA
jgi:hypothetical protein